MLEEIYKRTKNKDIFLIILSSIAIVAFWRGVWNLMDAYLLKENFLFSQIIGIIFGLFILIILAKTIN